MPEHALLLEKIIAGLILLAEAQNEVTKPFSLCHFWPAPRPIDLLKFFQGGGYQSCCFNLSVIYSHVKISLACSSKINFARRIFNNLVSASWQRTGFFQNYSQGKEKPYSHFNILRTYPCALGLCIFKAGVVEKEFCFSA